MRKILNLLLVSVFLTACATYKDTRSPEDQKSEFISSAQALTGVYAVKDSLNDEIKSQQVIASINFRKVKVLIKGLQGSILLDGYDCGGYYANKDNQSIFCSNNRNTGKSYFTLYHYTKSSIVSTNLGFGLTKEKVVNAGDYVLSMSGYPSGRQYYIILTKTENKSNLM